eukprot:3513275-Lingulodinium_polyedra.AAC.1
MDDYITLFANGLVAAEAVALSEAVLEQFRAIIRTNNESRRLSGLPWQLAQAMPVGEEGDTDIGAVQAAQALA